MADIIDVLHGLTFWAGSWAKGATSAGVSLVALKAAGINPNPYRKESAS